MRVVAVSGGKGGVGKTSFAVNVSSGLAKRGHRVLLVDMDPTAHATEWLAGDSLKSRQGLGDVLREEHLNPNWLVAPGAREGLLLLPSTAGLAAEEMALASAEGGQAVLRGVLRACRHQWDFVVLDCPPSVGVLTINALCASDAVVAPVTASYLGLTGLALLRDSIERLRRRLQIPARLLGCVLFAADSRESITDETRELLDRQAPGLKFKAEIRVSTAAKALPARHLTCWDIDADPRGAEDYAAVTDELVARLKTKRAA